MGKIDIDGDHWARQRGPTGFHVSLNEVEFEAGRRDIGTRVHCVVLQGRAAKVSGSLHNRGGGKGLLPGRRW